MKAATRRILIIGNTGSGKSTLINAFTNYFENFQDATESEETVAVIPSKFSFTSENGESMVNFVTQEVGTNSFEYGNDVINLIDTPGFQDQKMDQEMVEEDQVLTILNVDNDEAPPWLMVLRNKEGIGGTRNNSFWNKGCKGQFQIRYESTTQKLNQRYGYQRKVTVVEKNNNNGKLIENRHRRANDIEVNPGPTTRHMKELENFLRCKDSQQAKFKTQIHKVISNLVEDARNRIIPEKVYSEENLNTIQDIFFLAVKKNYTTDIVDKMDYLLTHFYDTVREEENKQGTFKRRFQESGVEIVTFHGELKRDIGTQFPEKLATTSEEESDDNSMKENAVPIEVTRKTKCKKRKRASRFSKSARIRIQIHCGH